MPDLPTLTSLLKTLQPSALEPLVFQSGWLVVWLIGLCVLALIGVTLSLWRQSLSRSQRWIIGALQLAGLVSLLLMMWRPAWRTEVVQPGDNRLAVVVDTSASMAMASEAGEDSRLALAQQIIDTRALLDNDQFAVQLVGLSDVLRPVDNPEALRADGVVSALADGLTELTDRIDTRTLAAVVLFSDGAETGELPDAQWWQQRRQSGVPVHVVGLGPEVIAGDVEIRDVQMLASAAPGAPVSARITLAHDATGQVRLRAVAGGALLDAESIDLAPLGTAGEPAESVHELVFDSGVPGTREVAFTITREADAPVADPNPINNRQVRMLQVQDAPRRVLYVEGEPRWEYKFLRRAVDELGDVELVSLLRTSPNKFYRQGVRDGDELIDGFPASREALFAYDAVIIGSLDAAELSVDQQVNLREFVNVRGGSLLLLGGRSGLADGGWGRSALARVLPTVLSVRRDTLTYQRERASVFLTEQGSRRPWMTLADNESASRDAWRGLPEIGDHQSLGELRPGAVVLLEAQPEGEVRRPLLVWHRYGQGQSFLLGTGGTWRWQMSLPSEDQRHERFWQQWLDELVADALPRIAVESTHGNLRGQDESEIRVVARRADYTRLEQTELPITLGAPDGQQSQVRLRAVPDEPGVFAGRVSMPQDGPWSVQVRLPGEGESPLASTAADLRRWWVRESGTAEYFGAARQSDFLQRLAAETGGQYFSASQVAGLDSVLQQRNAALTREVFKPLWNLPWAFALLFVLKALEWALRLHWRRL